MKWDEEKDSWLIEHAPWHTTSELVDAFEERFGIETSWAAIKNRRGRLGIKSQIPNKGQFQKGQAPWNRMPPRKKKPKRVPKQELITTDGRVIVRVDGDYVRKTRLVWEETHGQPLPDGYAVMQADGDKLNFDPGNLVAVPRGVLMRLNASGLKWHDRESLEACIAWVRLNESISNIEKRDRECATCGTIFKPEYKRQRRCRRCIDAGRKAHG